MTRKKTFVNESDHAVKFLLVIGRDPAANPDSQNVVEIEVKPRESCVDDFTLLHNDIGAIFLLRGSQVMTKLILFGDASPLSKDIDEATEIAAVHGSDGWSLQWRAGASVA